MNKKRKKVKKNRAKRRGGKERESRKTSIRDTASIGLPVVVNIFNLGKSCKENPLLENYYDHSSKFSMPRIGGFIFYTLLGFKKLTLVMKIL